MADHPSLLEKVSSDLDYVRGRVDELTTTVANLHVSVEHRVTKLEVRAGVVAALVSALVSLAAMATR